MRLGAFGIAGVLVACGARTPLADGTSTGAPAGDASTAPPHCEPGAGPVVMEPGGHVTYATWNGSLFAMKDVGDVYAIRSYQPSSSHSASPTLPRRRQRCRRSDVAMGP